MVYDVFLSYAHTDGDQARAIRDALATCGLAVWFDDTAVDDFSRITRSISTGLSRSKALVALYSSTYPTQRACQWELTAAFLAAARRQGLGQRILVVNPEDGPGHIEPVELRDGLHRVAPDPGNEAALRALARSIASHVEKLDGPLDAVVPSAPPSWYGHHAVGASRFVGRVTDMWRIHSALLAGEAVIVTGARGAPLAKLTGLGGIGKSLLAHEYALRFAVAYPGGVFWLDAGRSKRRDARADGGGGAAEQIRAIAAELGLPVGDLSPDETQAALRTALDAAAEPFLWVVDDLDSEADEELASWLAPGRFGSTLVTTRNRRFPAIGTELPLGALSEDEAVDLLRQHREPAGTADEDALRVVAQALGGHPLALDVSGSALRAEAGVRSASDFADALRRPTKDELELASSLEDELPNGHERSIAATLLRSIRRLSEPGVDFLRIAALLADAPIPPLLVVAALASADGLSVEEAKRHAVAAMHDAENNSLAEMSVEGGARRVHSLVSRTMRFTDESGARIMDLRTATIAALTDELAIRSATSAETTALLAHARELATSCADEPEAELLSLVAGHDFDRGDYVRALELQRKVLDTFRRVRALGDSRTTSAMSDVAHTLSILGKPGTAERLKLRILGERVMTLGPDHPETLHALNSLGETQRAKGDLEAALATHTRALNGFLRARGPGLLVSLNNLALTLADLGDLKGARELQEQALDGRRRLNGQLASETLTAASNLAGMQWQLGERDDARALEEEVLARRRETLGETHPQTLLSMNNLAVMLSEAGDLRAASDLQEEVLAGYRSVFGDDHQSAVTAKGNLANTLRARGDLLRARVLQEEALAAATSLWGEAHPSTLVMRSNLGGTLRDQGENAAALDLHRQAFEGLRETLGVAHPTTVAVAEALRATLETTGDRGAIARLDDELAATKSGESEPQLDADLADAPPLEMAAPPVAATPVDASRLDDTGWGTLLSQIVSAERWPELWGLVGTAPPTWTRAILKALADTRWEPAGAGAEQLRTLDALARQCPLKLPGLRLVEATLGDDAPLPYLDLGLAITPDAHLLAYGRQDGSVSLWSLPDATPVGTLEGHSSHVQALAVTADGGLLASGDQEGTVRLWDLRSLRPLKVLERDELGGAIASLAFAHGGATLAAGGTFGSVRIWREGRPTEHGTQHGHTSAVSRLVATPDDRYFVSAGLDSVALWKTGGDFLGTLDRPYEGRRIPGYTPSLTAGDAPGTVAWGGADGQVRRAALGPKVIDKAAAHVHRDAVFCLAAAPEQGVLASGGRDGTIAVARDGRWHSWDVQALGPSAVSALAISRDGNVLASGGHDFEVRVWDPAEGAAPDHAGDARSSLHKLPVWPEFSGHRAVVHTLTMSEDGAVLASVDERGSVWLWPIALLKALELPLAEIALAPIEQMAETAPAETKAWIDFVFALARHRKAAARGW